MNSLCDYLIPGWAQWHDDRRVAGGVLMGFAGLFLFFALFGPSWISSPDEIYPLKFNILAEAPTISGLVRGLGLLISLLCWVVGLADHHLHEHPPYSPLPEDPDLWRRIQTAWLAGDTATVQSLIDEGTPARKRDPLWHQLTTTVLENPTDG